MIDKLITIVEHMRAYNKKKFGNPIIVVSSQVTVLMLLLFCAIITSQHYFGNPIQCIQDDNSEGPSIPEHIMNSFCFISPTFSRVDIPAIICFMLLLFCAIITSQHYFGNPIQCIQGDIREGPAILEHIMNSFCFISPTFSRVDIPGGQHSSKYDESSREHSYYPWVPLVIFLQSLSFVLPQMIWSLNDNSYLAWYLTESTSSPKQDYMILMSKYLSKRINFFSELVLICTFSEVLYAVNVFGNFILTDRFLGGRFMDYGYRAYLNKDLYSETIFPKMTKCNFYKYGPSGTLEHREALCLMTLNVINEKLYLLLWFWFFILLMLSSFIILRRTFYLFMLGARQKCPLLIKKTLVQNISHNGFAVLINKLTFSDWLFFEYVKSQMDQKPFTKLLENIALEISEPYDLISSGSDYYKFL